MESLLVLFQKYLVVKALLLEGKRMIMFPLP